MPDAMLPFHLLHDFLEPDLVKVLLEFAVANEQRFEPTRVGVGVGDVDPLMRISCALDDLGPLKDEFASRFMRLSPVLTRQLRVNAFEPRGVELELVAHGDGAFYKQHIDTGIGSDRKERMISGVYYLHAEPKAFSGGALRLHELGPPEISRFTDIEPTHNTLVAFPSWMPHEVLPIECPSRRFIDSRFAVNCWLWRRKPD